MMNSNQVVTGHFAQEKDKEKILELNELEYGANDILVTDEDFAWRYSQNPAGQAIIPVIRDSLGNVVGFIWLVPLRIRIKGRDYLAATGTNLVIHPNYRNTFAYTKLIRQFRQAFKDNNIPFHFSFVSGRTFQEQQIRNPQQISTIPVLIKILDAKALVQSYFTKNWGTSLIGQLGRLVSPFVFRHRSASSGQEITIQLIDQFDEEFDDFWREVQNKYPISLVRDQAFLAWRFAKVSGRDYQILKARLGDRILGYAVLRCSTIRGVKTGLIMDLLVTNEAIGKIAGACLITEAEAYFRRHNMSLILGLIVPVATEYQLLSGAGYRHLPSIVSPRLFHFAFWIHNTPEKNLSNLTVQEWFITLADDESF